MARDIETLNIDQFILPKIGPNGNGNGKEKSAHNGNGNGHKKDVLVLRIAEKTADKPKQRPNIDINPDGTRSFSDSQGNLHVIFSGIKSDQENPTVERKKISTDPSSHLDDQAEQFKQVLLANYKADLEAIVEKSLRVRPS